MNLISKYDRWIFFARRIIGHACCCALLVTVCLIFSSFLISLHSHAEGTDRVRTSAKDSAYIQLIARNESGKLFAYYDGEEDYRLNVHICQLGETVNMGFSKTEITQGNGTIRPTDNIFFRVKAPDGTVVFGPQALQKTNANVKGNITSYQQAIAGPNTLAPNGYDPFQFVANQTGDYYIEFEVDGGSNSQNIGFRLFDITVTDLGGRRRDGRLWSKAWMLNTDDFTNPYNGSFYILSNDQIVTKMNLNGTGPFEFIFSANNTGTTNTGNSARDRMSVYNRNQTYPLYKVFLNDPDTLCFKSGILGAIVNTPTLSGCAPNFCINFTVTAPGEVQAFLDLNGTPGFQGGTKDLILQAKATSGDNCIPWNGRDGLGNPVSKGGAIPINLLYMNGLTHLPIFDVENNTKGYIVDYVRPLPVKMEPIKLYWDDSNIRPSSGPKGATNFTGCEGACHTWVFSSGNNDHPDYGNLNTINTWWYINPSSRDIFPSLSSQQIDANRNTPGRGKDNDTSICASAKELGLFGGLQGSNQSVWKRLSGSGMIADPAALTTKYFLSALDSTLRTISLELSSNNGCGTVRDTISIHLNPNPQITLSAPPAPCNPALVAAIANVKNAPGVTWSGSSNVFVPNASQKSVRYQPTPEELKAKTIQLKATTLPDSAHLCSVKSMTLAIPLISTTEFPQADKNHKYCNETQASVLLQSVNASAYAWYSEAGVMIGNEQTISVSPAQSTNYGLRLTDKNGCTDSTVFSVRVVCPPRLFVPNVITPSSDDVNADLSIYGAHYTNFEITIFSRWGEVIFNSKDPKHKWDGVYKNQNMPIGTYPWIVTYEGDSEEYKGPYKKVGDVTVVR